MPGLAGHIYHCKRGCCNTSETGGGHKIYLLRRPNLSPSTNLNVLSQHQLKIRKRLI